MSKCIAEVMTNFCSRRCLKEALIGAEYCSTHIVFEKHVETTRWWSVSKLFCSDDIKEVEVVSSTPKTIATLRPDGIIKVVNKSNQHTGYFQSFEAARNFQIEMLSDLLRKARQEVHKLEAMLVNSRARTPEDPTR